LLVFQQQENISPAAGTREMGIINPSILYGVPLVLLSFLLQVLPATSSWLPSLPLL